VSVAPRCGIYGPYGPYVYHVTVTNNGTVNIPGSSSVFLDFKDNTTETDFGFNTSLPSDISPGSMVHLNSTTWPLYTNATMKLTPGDEVIVTVFIEDIPVSVETDVVVCSGGGVTTVLNGTITEASFSTGCISTF
jgi:hypothetical protein